MNTMAAIFPVGDKFRARILFADNLEPVDFFRQTADRDELVGWLTVELPVDHEVVTRQRFQMELDHINLFNCRWDAEDIVLPKTEERMSDEVILSVLNDANTSLDVMENNLNAVLPSPIVED